MASIADWRNPTRASNLWDRIWLDDEEIECDLVTIGDADVSKDIDVKTRKGELGADYTDNGTPPAKFTITLEWLTAEKAGLGEAQLERFDPRAKGSETRPVGIAHPKPNERGIMLVLIQAVSFPKIVGGKRQIQLSVVEYNPATPKDTGGGVGKAKPVGYGDPEEDIKDVGAYYDQRAQEIADDVDAGRMSEDDGADAILQNDTDRVNAVSDLHQASESPASQDNVDSNCFSDAGL